MLITLQRQDKSRIDHTQCYYYLLRKIIEIKMEPFMGLIVPLRTIRGGTIGNHSGIDTDF